MAKRAPAVHRTPQPFRPIAKLTLVCGERVIEVLPDNVSVKEVGLKAYGLASIPQEWTKPFVVISGDYALSSQAVIAAMTDRGLNRCDRVIVRSSGVMESLAESGALESAECAPAQVPDQIARLSQRLPQRANPTVGTVHWIVQELAATRAKGHLSNERRLCQDLRDWIAEEEASTARISTIHPIAIRTWRDARERKLQPLMCLYWAGYLDTLEDVARWAYDRQLRMHFEWVWNGKTIYIVQAVECLDVSDGVVPTELVKMPQGKFSAAHLESFRVATSSDFDVYRKLANALLYSNLGYKPINFFVLDDPDELRLILQEGRCSDRLARDLRLLTARPLVIRTDGLNLPTEKRQMLPRSDELRSELAARRWLVESFRGKIGELVLDGGRLCLIAHHFVPAAASAWCQAHPNRRRVRIESLWGIPEGLYWYAHDVFDVDTLVPNVPALLYPAQSLPISERLRHKGRFVAPNRTGDWVLHQAAAGPDWSSSIRRKQWIEQIAWNSRRIAQQEGKSVVVMWLVDIPRQVSPHSVIPWYHDEWKHESGPPKAAPRKKLSSSTEFALHTRADWETLQQRCRSGETVARVLVDPAEPDLVRDKHFAEALATLAKDKQFVVELSGGILSHAYYLLTSSGCAVECSDLYAIGDEEIQFNKLVRDKIPDVILSRGENVDLLRLEGEALIAALKRKIIEEAFEVLDSQTTQQILEELADLLEVTNALASRLGIQKEVIEKTRRQKAAARGGFDDAVMLSHTVLASSLDAPLEQANELLPALSSRIEHTISRVEELPLRPDDIHADKRHDLHGTAERQFSMSLPAHAAGFRPPRVSFELETQDGRAHDLILEVLLDRQNADLRCRLRLINAPMQLNLKFSNEED